MLIHLVPSFSDMGTILLFIYLFKKILCFFHVMEKKINCNSWDGKFSFWLCFFFPPFKVLLTNWEKKPWMESCCFIQNWGYRLLTDLQWKAGLSTYKTASPLPPPPPIKDHLPTTTSFSSLYRQLTKVTAKSGQLLKPHHKWPLTLWISCAQPSYIEKPQKWPLGSNHATFWATYQTKSLLAVCVTLNFLKPPPPPTDPPDD